MKPLYLLIALMVTVQVRGQESASPAPSTKELRAEYQVFGERLLFQIGLHHSSANDPLLYLRFHCGVSGETSEETLARFIEGHENDLRNLGHGPHVVFIDARVPKKLRANMIPVARIGDYGLFAWPDTSDALVSAIGEEVRTTIQSSAGTRQKSASERLNSAAGGEYLIQGQPVTLGDAQELARLVEQGERAQEGENARIREDNIAQKPSAARHSEVFQLLVGPMTSKPGMPNIAPVTQANDRPEEAVAELHKYTPGLKQNGYIPAIFVGANAAKAELSRLRPVMRVGDYGFFADPDITPNDLQRLEDILLARSKEEEFLAAAHRQGIDEFGDADALKALVASTPERAVPVPVAAPLAPAPALSAPGAPEPAKAASVAAVEREVSGSAILTRSEPPSSPPEPSAPVHIAPSQNPGGISCIFPNPRNEELKHESARRQAEFNQRMAAKGKKIQAALKDKSRQDRERLDRNYQILAEMLRQDKEKHRLFREQRLAHIKAESARADAIFVESGTRNGQPYIYVRNNTDIYLNINIEYSITVGGENRRESFPYAAGPHGEYTNDFIIGAPDEGKNWSGLEVTHHQWGPHAWNYEGTWL
jgi:hypothetical protein